MPAEPSPAERARLAAEALAQARADARARGEGVPGRGSRPAGQAAAPSRVRGRPRGGGQPGGDGQPAPDGPAESRDREGPLGSGQDRGAGAAAESGVSGQSPINRTATGGGAADSVRARPGRSGSARASRSRRARRDDPEPLRAAIGGLMDARGWRDELAVGALFGRWNQIVGAELAAHTRPEAFAAGELLVTADSTAWATQLRLLATTLVARVNSELGGPVVRRVKVRGPAPPPKSGPWRVRGGRGPRDDYG